MKKTRIVGIIMLVIAIAYVFGIGFIPSIRPSLGMLGRGVFLFFGGLYMAKMTELLKG